MPNIKTRRRLTISLTALLLFMTQTICVASTTRERIQWQKTPIAIGLNVGEERLVHFRGPVSVGLPASLESRLRTQTVNGTVYFKANSAFASTRVMVREIEGGQIYLFDLSADTNSSATSGGTQPIEIYLNETHTRASQLVETGHGAGFGYVSLTRYAAQQLYAPLRLLSSVPGIVRVPIQQQAVALVPGNAVVATPLVAWRAGRLFVTAVKLTNRLAHAQTLDPRTLRGAWLSAAFQHSRLLPAGDEADTTALYLVSEQPFHLAL